MAKMKRGDDPLRCTRMLPLSIALALAALEGCEQKTPVASPIAPAKKQVAWVPESAQIAAVRVRCMPNGSWTTLPESRATALTQAIRDNELPQLGTAASGSVFVEPTHEILVTTRDGAEYRYEVDVDLSTIRMYGNVYSIMSSAADRAVGRGELIRHR